MKANAYLASALLALTMSCASNNEKIVFTDELPSQISSTSAPVKPPPKSLSKSDQIEIEQMIYSYLLERHFWDNADYSAVFLQADDAQVAAMIKKFPHHEPPIKPGYHASIQSHRTPVDKDTNKAAMILSVDVNEPNPDDSVDAIGRWYAGDLVTGFHAFHLVKVDGNWQISEVK